MVRAKRQRLGVSVIYILLAVLRVLVIVGPDVPLAYDWGVNEERQSFAYGACEFADNWISDVFEIPIENARNVRDAICK